MGDRVAVIGVGQSKQAQHRFVSIAGLVREAVDAALADAQVTFRDIDVVVVGKTTDFFEGVMMPELFLVDAIGGSGKPVVRVGTGGAVGGHACILAASLIEARLANRVLAVAFSKEGEGDLNWAFSQGSPYRPPVLAGPGGVLAAIARQYIERSKAPEHIGWQVAANHKLNALRNPYAHLHIPDITVQKVRESPILWDPIRLLEACPSSEGSCALVLSNEEGAHRGANPPAWVHGMAFRSESGNFPGRDDVFPAAGYMCATEVYREARISDPIRQIDVLELYVPFSWFEPIYLENLGFADRNNGWKLTDTGVTSFQGTLPVNPSGGVLAGNPTGATGMIRFAEAALQVRGSAGEHQVGGAKLALGHAQGGPLQFQALWLVGSDKPA